MIREEVFILAYFGEGGFPYPEVFDNPEERAWFVNRLLEQKEKELKQMKRK